MINNLIINKINISPLTAPLNQPFRTALGQHDVMENILLTIELKNGIKGYGEAAIATHITGETIKKTKNNFKKITPFILGKDVQDIYKISNQIKNNFPNNRSALAAVEMAMLDALTRSVKIPLWKFFGPKCRKLITDITIVIADLNETAQSARKYYRQGFRAFKIKIGRDFDLDINRVLTVKKIVKNSTMYLDANQGYTADQTLNFIKTLKKFNVKPDLIEQPVAKDDWEGLRKVSRLAGVDVCADESASSLEDVKRIVKMRAAQAINIKFMKTGILEARDMVLYSKYHNLKLMIGGMMESSLAMSASAHLASGLGIFDYIDLDTPFFLRRGFERNPYLSRRGVYDLGKVKRGIGIIL